MYPHTALHCTGLHWRSIAQEWVYLGRIRSHSKPICSLMFGKFPDGSVQVRTFVREYCSPNLLPTHPHQRTSLPAAVPG